VSAKNLSNCDKITLIVPHGRPVIDIISQLQGELDIVKDIKSDITRNNVMQALNNLIGYLKALKEIPEDGLILNAHKDKVELKISKKPIKINLYRCDDHFYTYMGEVL
jgi:peptide chain release factor subunit 1